jgi:hypothetical protein
MSKPPIPAPTHLLGYTVAIDGAALDKYEWRGLLQDQQGNTLFKIKYDGKLHEEYPRLIVGTEQAPPLVIAEHPANGKEIVLFDGSRHGYDAMFCDEYGETKMNARHAAIYYRDEQGEELFSIEVAIYNHHFYNEGEEDEMVIDDDGWVTLINGSRVDVETARRDAFDVLKIRVINASGLQTTIVEAELA